MNGYYSQDKVVKLYGFLEELVDMHYEIDEFAESDDQIWTQELDFDIETGHIEKYLSKIVVQKTSGKLRVNIIGSELNISGATEFIAPFASYFHFDEFDTFPEINRLEYHKSHGFLDPKSLSVTIGIRKNSGIAEQAH